MPKSVKISLLAVSVALVLSIFLGVNAYGVRAADDGQQGAYRQINVYGEVCSISSRTTSRCRTFRR